MEKIAPVSYPIHDLISHRWSPRAFSSRPVSEKILNSLLEAARWAPSSYNEQPWSFIVATRDTPAAHTRLLDCVVPGNRAWARHAPVLMVSVAKVTFERNGKPNPHAFHDVGLAVAQMTLQATHLELGVHQMAGIDTEQVRSAYRMGDEYEPVAGIAIGYPGDPGMLPDKLKDLETKASERKPHEEMLFPIEGG